MLDPSRKHRLKSFFLIFSVSVLYDVIEVLGNTLINLAHPLVTTLLSGRLLDLLVYGSVLKLYLIFN